MKKGITVLSLFDGISGAQLALQRAGIKVDKYYASEIDKYAIQITQKNFPDTIQIGDVTKLKGSDLPKIDLIIGGSPCQGFSFSGKQLNFEDERSKLFFEFVRLLEECKPKYFLLENVKMKKEFKDVITNYMGVEPALINSALLSSQNRERLYWSNFIWQDIKYADDFEECEMCGEPFCREHDKHFAECECIGCMEDGIIFNSKEQGFRLPADKGILLRDVVFSDALFNGASRGRYLVNGVRQDHKMKTAGKTTQQFEMRLDGKSNTITTALKDNVVLTKEGYAICMHNLYGGFGEKEHRTFLEKSPTIRTASGGGHIPSLLLSDKALEYMDRKIKSGRTHWDFGHNSDVRKNKSQCVVANFFKGVPYNVLKDWNCIRYFHPIEVERLQTYPDDYTDGVSKTQRYKALGNSFTVDVIAFLLKKIKNF